ncbi:MAG TPA: DUF4876 domain-containing protein [Gemmatimonadales bacterium]
MTSRRVFALVLSWAFGLGGCTTDLELISPGSPPDRLGMDSTTTDSTDTNVQRATLIVTAAIDLESPGASAVVADLGFPFPAITGAAVEVRHRVSNDVFTATTDSSGKSELLELLTGTYDISVVRLLTADERALLRPELQDVSGFGAGGSVRLQAPETSVTISSGVGRRGSLVISEVFDQDPLIAADNAYFNATYLELYNNSDTTIYLDGKLVGWGPPWGWAFSAPFAPCSVTQVWQNDPDGLWSPMLMRLPGHGRQYPLAPGRAAVIATDGIDHSAVDSRLPNLSSAAFETVGPSDVDNPSVPNATLIVVEYDLFGRGILFISSLSNIYFVADPVDLSTVPWMRPVTGAQIDLLWPRIPRDRILDVYTSIATASVTATLGGDRFCEHIINSVFDNQAGRFNGEQGFYSIARKSLGVFGGRALLQRTKTSALDFALSNTLTPGRIP